LPTHDREAVLLERSQVEGLGQQVLGLFQSIDRANLDCAFSALGK
jgi:hypothetical protein